MSVKTQNTGASGTYAHIAAGQATTVVKTGPGILFAIVFNTSATATNVTTVYDNTAGSGTVIGVPVSTSTVSPQTLTYGPHGLAFNTGLTIKTATANGADMTVIYA